jgi:flagellin
MALTVQTNNAAITALKNLNTNSANMNQSLNRLSSGFRINSAADDSSGFAISSKLDAQSNRLKAASQNAMQATAMVKMADAGINEIQNMIGRIQVLATQAASSNNAGELTKLDAERSKLESQIDKIANSTNYNGVNLLNGTGGLASSVTSTGVTAITMNNGNVADSYTLTSAAGTASGLKFTITDTTTGAISVVDNVAVPAAGQTSSFSVGGFSVTIDSTAAATAAAAITNTGSLSAFQVGADNNANNQVTVNLGNSYTTTSLGLGGSDLLSQANAQAYIDTAKTALDTLIANRADLGATQNQLSYVSANLATSIEQSVAAVSSIRDADMAAEMANFTKNQILTQAGTSMLAQANQAAQNVLTLFR